jgi:glycosyltransferase involved in cell wall biosynthesis
MAKPDISNLDASVREASELQSVLSSESAKAEKRISVEDALRQPRVAVDTQGRTALRVLFISQDESLLNPDTQSLDGFINLANMFEEVHILILREGIRAKTPALRVSQNVWLYTAAAKHWFLTPQAAIELVEEQLVFAAGFRPDLIIARDPFESAIVAKKLKERFARPTQLHIVEDFLVPDFTKKRKHNRWRTYLARFTVQHFSSVRVSTDALCAKIQKQFAPKDLAVLPRYHNYHHVRQRVTRIDLKGQYKQYVFLMVYAGDLSHTSDLFKAIDAARFVLRNPRVGLIVLGDGPAREECKRRAKLLGIEKQIIFEKRKSDLTSYVVSADLVLAPDTTSEVDEYIFSAAAAAVPVVMARTSHRADVFEDGVSAFLVDPEDTQTFSARIGELLNNVGLRKIVSESAVDAIERKFQQDPHYYKHLYQTTIEDALFVDDEPASDTQKTS